MLKNLILSAAAAGVAAGLFTAVLQHVTTTPIIIEAERYEGGGPTHDHSAAAGTATTATHEAEEESEPADGVVRTLYTSLATTVIGIGFSLALLGAMTLSNVPISARSGLAFGVAGFAAVSLAPALGLPPEIPGAGAAELGARQAWWFFACTATAVGLAGLLIAERAVLQVGGVVLIALPHLVGAPQTPAFTSTAPAELAAHFVAASLAVTAIFWAVLGYASGAFHERFSHSR